MLLFRKLFFVFWKRIEKNKPNIFTLQSYTYQHNSDKSIFYPFSFQSSKSKQEGERHSYIKKSTFETADK